MTGFLVDTRDTRALARAVVDALDFAAGPGGDLRAERARETVARNFTIEAMAASLSEVYAQVGEVHDPRRPVTSPVMVS